MKWLWLYILLLASIILRSSEKKGHESYPSSSSESSVDFMCDQALTHHVPSDLKADSFRVRPFLKRLLEEQQQLELSRHYQSPRLPRVDSSEQSRHEPFSSAEQAASYHDREPEQGGVLSSSPIRIDVPISSLQASPPSPHSPVQGSLSEYLLRAYHKALLEKETELSTRAQEIAVHEYKIKKKMSRKASAGFAAITGLASSIVTLIATIFSSQNKD